MTSPAAASKPRLDSGREEEILTATTELLCEVGYDKLTFDTLAQRVRAGKATLYRRWPTKADLVMDALTREAICPFDDPGTPDTGSLVGDLEALMCDKSSEMTSRLPGLVAAIGPALHRDPDLTDRFAEQFVRPRSERAQHVLAAAQRRGEIGPDADLHVLAAVMPGLAITHLLETGRPPTESYLRTVLHQVLLPACAASLRQS